MRGQMDRKHVMTLFVPLCSWVTIEHTFTTFVCRLLKETSTQLETTESESKKPKWMRKMEACQTTGPELDEYADEKRMLSRYGMCTCQMNTHNFNNSGIWMLCGLCTPAPDCPSEAIGHLMSMVFQWFGTTSLLSNDQYGAALEKLKQGFVCNWLTAARGTHPDVFVQCLLPRPPEYAKVGGMWDKLSSRQEQIKEGLTKILALIPYEIISIEVRCLD
jgi:hypothetical protein